ncbi:MAG: hypothetical protein M3P11_01805 [Actinomycetota bacterium]|nr:hypothetical protein [Actinomycetota bacterium]
MGRTLRRVASSSLSLLIVGVVVVGQTTAGSAALTDAQRSARAIGFIKTNQKANGSVPAFSPIGSTSDAVLATVAAGTGRDVERRALSYLRDQVAAGNVDAVGLRAKVVLATTAAVRDPRTFGGRNLIRAIRRTMAGDGRFDSASVLDQALAILAIESAGVTPRGEAIAWLENAQCPDGGWQYDAPYNPTTEDDDCLSIADPGTDYFQADTNTTSYAVQAIEAFDPTTVYPASPFTFFGTMRDATHDGWGYTAGYTTTDANSTALVIQAYAAAGKNVPSGGLDALRALQHKHCGAFSYTWNVDGTRTAADVGATIGAVPGLMLKPLPFTGAVIGNALDVAAC